MQQSRSLIKALEAAADVLTSGSRDLKELAEMAAATSGIPANRILMNVDLTGIDLTEKQIDDLTDKGARYHAAHLTNEQRTKFQKGEQEGRARQRRRKIRSIRVQMISDFIDTFEAKGAPLVAGERKQPLDANLLRQILLTPLATDYPADTPLDDRYTKRVLVRLAQFARVPNLDFFQELFRLIGDLHSEIGEVTCVLILDDYVANFGDDVGTLIGQLQPSANLDTRWVLGNHFNTTSRSYRGNADPKGNVGVNELIMRAKQISRFRPVHPKAIEEILDVVLDPFDKLAFLETVDFDCSGDEAERIALRVTSGVWPASRTREILEANVPTKVRGALFRQLMHEGNPERSLELLRWLNNNRGAVGGLSLDDALARIDSFPALIDFATDVRATLATNQINILRRALERTAKNSSHRAKVRQLLPERK